MRQSSKAESGRVRAITTGAAEVTATDPATSSRSRHRDGRPNPCRRGRNEALSAAGPGGHNGPPSRRTPGPHVGGVVDLDAGLGRVTASLQEVDGELRFMDPKTDRARRTVSIPPATVALLRATARNRPSGDYCSEKLGPETGWSSNEAMGCHSPPMRCPDRSTGLLGRSDDQGSAFTTSATPMRPHCCWPVSTRRLHPRLSAIPRSASQWTSIPTSSRQCRRSLGRPSKRLSPVHCSR